MTDRKRQVHTTVKDVQLIEKRRSEMIRGAVQLFKKKGFHRTTTREIAKASGFSIGTMYEYIRTKEDVLYLVCDSIYDQVKERLQQIDFERGTLESLKLGIAYYFRVMDEMQDEVLVMYQEAKSLSKDALPYVLKKEVEMVAMVETLIQRCVDHGLLDMDQKKVHILAQNIFIQGQMWGFRRWMLQKSFSLDEYITLQTDLLFSGVNGYEK
ncbi:TetR/AcrR family transcriptional regulator [Domibacillus epiphyticus]|uniref:TetR family transcriptional regulator n=1 Tax=Domibacillus epiphyticus TaxID=1714355 RepID=A0A1V2A6V6_9BACI|nr:TetR/AcrR family transcriptional regulator [Domibacillus epiphyticus]OMP66564.1 TetR family transcriptional regulator [Domibacillus epiphyticus]